MTKINANIFAYTSYIKIGWIPSHVNIDGNEKADSCANAGRIKRNIDIDVKCENIVHEENINDKIEEITGSDKQIQNDDSTSEEYDLNDKNDNHKENNHTPVRKSERLRKRLVEIDPEDIGENDNEKDKDYKI